MGPLELKIEAEEGIGGTRAGLFAEARPRGLQEEAGILARVDCRRLNDFC
jgi:hypothetical protein